MTTFKRPRAGIPLPRPTALSSPHWDGARAGRLRVQKCLDCGVHVFIPQPCCTSCMGSRLEWVDSSGRGTLYSYTIVHRPQQPAFEVPYAVAIVQLEEGWHMLSNLIDVELEKIEVGMPLEVVFHEMQDGITLPLFRPRA